MPGGKYDETSSNIVDNENDDKGVQANFDIARKVSKSTNPITNKSGEKAPHPSVEKKL